MSIVLRLRRLFGVALVLSVTAPAGAADRSPLEAVRAELSPDGQLYTFIDLERGWARVGEEIDRALVGLTEKPPRIAVLLESLGLTRIRAVGMSSEAVPGGYDNRFYLHMPEGRGGIFALLPDEPKPFAGLAYAPEDTDLYAEMHLDLGALFRVVTAAGEGVARDVGEFEAFQAGLASLEPPVRSFLEFRGTVVAVVRFVDATPGSAGAEATGARIDAFARLDALGPVARTMLEGTETAQRVEHPQLTVFKASDGVLVAIDGDAVLVASDLAFLEECRQRRAGLDRVPAVQALLAKTSATGHSLVYTSPRLLEELRKESGLDALLEHEGLSFLPGTDRRAISQALASLPHATEPSVSVVVARPDGILVRERSVTSSKAALPIVAAFTPDFLGEFAIQAVRAASVFTAKSRASEEARQKLEPDLAAIAAAAQAYFHAHDAAESVTLETLREQRGGESLPDLAALSDVPLEISRRSDLITLIHREHGEIRHVIPLTEAQRAAIEANLERIDAAAARYFARSDETSVYGLYSLFPSDDEAKPVSVVGEDYDSISVMDDSIAVSITTPGDQLVAVDHDRSLVTKARRQFAEQRYAIERNLAQLDAAAQAWLKAHVDAGGVDTATLVSEGGITAPEAVAGEAYDGLYFAESVTTLSVESPTLGTVTYARPLDAKIEAAVRDRLTELARLAGVWFEAHPEGTLVLAAELLPEEQLTLHRPTDESAWEGDPITTTPKLSTLVIRRDTKELSLVLEGGHTVVVPIAHR